MAYTTVPVVGTFKINGSLAASGTVVLTAPEGKDSAGTTLPSRSFTLVNGAIPGSSNVPAVNNPGTVINGPKMYTVTITLDGTVLPPSFLIPRAGSQPIDLSYNLERPLTGSASTWTDISGKPTFATVATTGSASDISAGTLADARIPSAIARDSEVTAAIGALTPVVVLTQSAYDALTPNASTLYVIKG